MFPYFLFLGCALD